MMTPSVIADSKPTGEGAPRIFFMNSNCCTGMGFDQRESHELEIGVFEERNRRAGGTLTLPVGVNSRFKSDMNDNG